MMRTCAGGGPARTMRNRPTAWTRATKTTVDAWQGRSEHLLVELHRPARTQPGASGARQTPGDFFDGPLKAARGFQGQVSVGEPGRQVLRWGVDPLRAVPGELLGDALPFGPGAFGCRRVVHRFGAPPAGPPVFP